MEANKTYKAQKVIELIRLRKFLKVVRFTRPLSRFE